MNWYYSIKGEQLGPVSDYRLKELAQSGEIQPTTVIWQKGMDLWVPAGEVMPDLFKPVEQTTEENSPPPPPLPEIKSKPDASYLMRRLMAKMFDFALITLVLMAFLQPLVTQLNPPEDPELLKEKLQTDTEFAKQMYQFYVKSFLYSAIGHIAYQTLCLTLWSATFGKLLLGLRVIKSSGDRLTPLQALCRSSADLLNLIFCSGISYVSILVDSRRLGIHDRMCDTRVVEKEKLNQ